MELLHPAGHTSRVVKLDTPYFFMFADSLREASAFAHDSINSGPHAASH